MNWYWHRIKFPSCWQLKVGWMRLHPTFLYIGFINCYYESTLWLFLHAANRAREITRASSAGCYTKLPTPQVLTSLFSLFLAWAEIHSIIADVHEEFNELSPSVAAFYSIVAFVWTRFLQVCIPGDLVAQKLWICLNFYMFVTVKNTRYEGDTVRRLGSMPKGQASWAICDQKITTSNVPYPMAGVANKSISSTKYGWWLI